MLIVLQIIAIAIMVISFIIICVMKCDPTVACKHKWEEFKEVSTKGSTTCSEKKVLILQCSKCGRLDKSYLI